MTTKIQLRRDTGANWDANSTVVLSAGEIGVNLTNGQFKLGDGTSTWAQLGYYVGSGSTGNYTFSGDAMTVNNSITQTSISGTTNTTPTVVWSSTSQWISGVKMTITVEANVTGDATGWHTQSCEALIAARGNGTGDPQLVVYGVIHTSVGNLATFTVQRNLTTNLIELVATADAGVNGQTYLRIHSVEMASRD